MRNSLFIAIATTVLLTINVVGQEAKNPAPSVTNVQVTPSVKSAEVGQDVKLTVVATDASGNVIKEQPSVYFAGPFDIAAADDNGNVKLFGTGEVTVGALVGSPIRTATTGKSVVASDVTSRQASSCFTKVLGATAR